MYACVCAVQYLLGSGHHLHGLRDFLNVFDWLQADWDGFQSGHVTGLLRTQAIGKDGRAGTCYWLDPRLKFTIMLILGHIIYISRRLLGGWTRSNGQHCVEWPAKSGRIHYVRLFDNTTEADSSMNPLSCTLPHVHMHTIALLTIFANDVQLYGMNWCLQKENEQFVRSLTQNGKKLLRNVCERLTRKNCLPDRKSIM